MNFQNSGAKKQQFLIIRKKKGKKSIVKVHKPLKNVHFGHLICFFIGSNLKKNYICIRKKNSWK
jgi:hypothetical protein